MTETEHLSPPVTSGIAPQPSAEQLAAVAAHHGKPATRKNISVALFVAVVFLLGVGTYALLQYRGWQSVSQGDLQPAVSNQSDESATKVEDIQPNTSRQLLEVIADGSFTSVFEVTGFVLDTQWQDRGIAYDLTYLFYIDNPTATMATDLELEVTDTAPVVIVQLEVADTRLSGAPQQVAANEYLALRFATQDIASYGYLPVTLSPGEKRTVFVPFTLPERVQTFLVLSGLLQNPFVSEVTLTQSSPMAP